MSSIDNRIVRMQFDNKSFESNVKDTQKTLADLEKSLELKEGSKGFDNVEKAASSFNLDPVSSAIETVSSGFSALAVVGFTAIQSLTNSAIDLGKKLVGAIYDPLVEGGKQRALNIEQAKFQFEGLGIDVEKAMAAASYAVNDTAFSLDAAAKAAGSFAASGLTDFDEMGTALRAISGVAAQTSSSYEDIANVFTTVAGNGRLMGQQLLQLSSRGLNAAATLSKQLGVSEAEVRKMVSAGQISFEMFYTAMDEAFGEHAKKANETFAGSAANIRANLSRIGADVAASSFENLKNVNNALLPTLKALHVALTPAIDAINEFQTGLANLAIDKIENIDFKWLTDSIPAGLDVVKNLGTGLLSIAKPIGAAYRDIFPKTTADSFLAVANNLKELTSQFKLNETDANNLRRTFAGLFTVVDLGRKALTTVAKGFLNLIGATAPAGSGILSFTGLIGDMLVRLNNSTSSLKGFSSAFEALASVVNFVATLIKAGFNVIVTAIRSFLGLNADKATDEVTASLDGLGKVGERISSVFSGVTSIFTKLGQVLEPVIGKIPEVFRVLKDTIVNALSQGDFKPILDLVNGGIFASLLLGIGNFIKSLTGSTNEIGSILKGIPGGSFLAQIKKVLGGVSEALSAFTASIKADTLKTIATAIAILAGSLLVLSLIPSDKLAGSLGAVTVLMTELFATMAVFEKIMGSAGFKAMPKIALSMIGLGAAILVLSFAVKNLAGLDWDGLIKGLLGVASLSATLVISAKSLSTSSGKLIQGAAGLVVFGAAILVLVQSVKQLGALNLDELAKGLAGVAVVMGEVVLFTKLVDKMGIGTAAAVLVLAGAIKVLSSSVEVFGAMDMSALVQGLVAMGALLGELAIFINLVGGAKNMVAIGTGITLVAAAMKILSGVLYDFGNMEWEEIAKGLVALGGSLLIIAGALQIMPKNMVGTAVGLIGVAAALVILSEALTTMGGMTWEEIAKGLITLAGSLTILAVALYAMTGTIAGAAALLLASAALLVLSGVLLILGNIPMETIAIGLLAIAGVFLVLGVAAAVLGPVTVALLALSAAMLLFGVGVLAAGVGLIALSVALNLLGAAAADGIPALFDLIIAITGMAVLAAPVAIMSAALLLLGVAFLALSVGMIALSAAFTLLGASSVVGIEVLKDLAGLVEEISPLILDFLLLGVAFIAFGAGVAVAAIGILALGAALLVLGAGLNVSAAAAEDGIDGLFLIAEAALDLLLATPVLLAVGAGLLAFGAGALAAGAGALAAGAGFVVMAAGMVLFNAAAPDVLDLLGSIAIMSAEMLVATPSLLALGAALLVLGAGAVVGGAGALVGGAGLIVMAEGLNAMAKTPDGAIDKIYEVTDMSWELTKSSVGLAAGGAALIVLGNGAIALGQGLKQMGSSAPQLLVVAQALVEMSKQFDVILTTANKAAPQVATVTKKMVTDMVNAMNSGVASMKTATTKFFQTGIIQVIGTSAPLATTAMKNLITNMIKVIGTSTPTALAGMKSMVDGMVNTVNNGQNAMSSAANSFVSAGINRIRDSRGSWEDAAGYVADGFIQGLNNQVNAVAQAAAIMAQAAVDAANSKLRIRSPSRVTMETGGYFGEGFVLGIHPYVAYAADAAESMASSAIDALGDVLQKAAEVVNDEMPDDPVIKPILDIDQLKEDARSIAEIFGDAVVDTTSFQAAMVASSSRNRNGAKVEDDNRPQVIQQEYKFEQINNSPKALTRLQIYRDTKNLFNTFKELVNT